MELHKEGRSPGWGWRPKNFMERSSDRLRFMEKAASGLPADKENQPMNRVIGEIEV